MTIKLGAGLVVGTVLLALVAPMIVVAGASFDGGQVVRGKAFLNFPPTEWSLQYYMHISSRLEHALSISVAVATIAALGGVILGVPAALGLARSRVRGKAFIAAIFRAPLQIPAIVIGVAFLQTYYLLGRTLGFHLASSFVGLVIGHLFVAVPYVVGTVSSVLLSFNSRLEEAALSLGATRWRTFRRVTLPIILPGVYTGLLYAFMVSFGDVPISLFLAGSQYTTLPLEIYESMQFEFDASILALSTLIMAGSLIVLLALQRLIGLDSLLRSGDRR